MVISTRGLSKRYGDKAACRDLHLAVPAGQVYGFLGPNGAGKSTCIKMLTGLVRPTSGEGEVLGRPLGDVKARRAMGYLPELFRYQDFMTGRDLLRFHARLCGMKNAEGRITALLKRVGLEGQEHRKLGSYSKGMQQRAGLACALLPEPELLFLDEPTSALDPIGRRDIREIILELRATGVTVFLNSHLLSEVEAVCDSVAIILGGSVVKAAPIGELLMPRVRVTLEAEGLTDALLAELSAARGVALAPRAEGGYEAELGAREEIPELAAFLTGRGARLFALAQGQETLESAFLRIVGEEEAPSQPS